ncbi:hypothetical protein [Myroides odoratimimus]|uniref:Uncharacterized protein n=1 Tax=Myroides odoratimimus CIP 101113 TaxID=883154 RepID=A0AAV3F729_9FLAO|nr:hypothetical protein [Myroides odoratimimus]EHO14686.1 hypothetical protein HMPREF9715_00571 [Myroides odoratimimus CIP 101113]
MELLIRKVTKSKWSKDPLSDIKDLSADAITSCLRTSSNTLSLWHVKDVDSMNDAILALASGFDRIDTIDVVLLEKDYLNSHFNIEQTEGKTKVPDLINTHYDICHLTYEKIGNVATYVQEQILSKKIKRYRVVEIATILNEAIALGRLKNEDLKEKVRITLEKYSSPKNNS